MPSLSAPGNAPATPGQVITFYSYKGGTGRTMAVANIAWILATNGKRVLAVDWDLESPGLHRYFHPFLVDKRLRASRGVIDLIRDFATAAMQPHGSDRPDWYTQYADVERAAVSLTWPFPAGGGIDLLPAGQQDASYSKAVSTFEWPNFYERLGGSIFLQALRDSMRQNYDYVLVDSRTGLSDTASICTVQLSDTVVNCFTLSEQSISGAAVVAESIVGQRADNPVRMLPVPMRVEDAEQIKLEAGRDYARHRFAPVLDVSADAAERYWGDVEIPYKPFYAYEEILATFGDRSHQETSLLAAFERLTRTITNGEVERAVGLDERDRRRWLGEFERPKAAATLDVVISYASVDRMWAEWVAAELDGVGLRVTIQEVDFSTGQNDIADVEQVLASANRALVLLSRDYVRSPNAGAFWRLVVNRDPTGGGRFLVPVRLDASRVAAPFGDRYPAVDFANLGEDRAREMLFAALDQVPAAADGAAADAADRRGPRFPGTLPPVWNVPQRNTVFTGRAPVLEGLRDHLATRAMDVRPQALYGLGGVGKTQVAIEYAHRFAADYDAVWWISADQVGQARAGLAGLSTQLGLPYRETVEETVAMVLDALRRGEPHRRWLLVFDNADDPEELQSYIPQGPGHVILTSRNLAWARQVNPVPVGVFTRLESVAFLQRRVPAITAADAGQVAERLGDLPLAMAQAGAWLVVTGMPVEQYLELLDTHLPRVLEEEPPPGYERTAAATWLLSLGRLREQMPAAAKLLEVCAFFGPEPIPLSLFRTDRFAEVLQPYDESFGDLYLQGQLMQEIRRYALAEIDTERASIELHRLVQTVIRAALSPQEQEENTGHVHAVLAAANPKNPDEPVGWDEYARLWPHLEPSGALSSRVPSVRRLVYDIVRFLVKRGDLTSAQNLAESAMAEWRRQSPDEDDLTTVGVSLELANSLRFQAKYDEAEELDQAAYAALAPKYGTSNPYTIISISGRASDLRARGQYSQAHELDKEAVSLSRASLGESNIRTLYAANNLGVSLRLVGDFAGAVALSRDVWVTCRRVLKDEHSLTLLSAGNYGRDLRNIGDLKEARSHLEKWLAISTQAQTERHPDTLRMAKTLAVTLRKLGDFEGALALTQDNLRLLTTALRRHHPDTLGAAINLACVQSALDDHRRALRLAEETLEGFRAELGEEHICSLACANNLAIFQRKAGDLEAATLLAERVVDGYRRSLGDDHPFTLSCRINHANNIFDAHRYPEALEEDRDTYDRIVRILGGGHPDALSAGGNFATSLLATGDEAGAARLRNGIEARCAATLGADHPTTQSVRAGERLNCDLDPPTL